MIFSALGLPPAQAADFGSQMSPGKQLDASDNDYMSSNDNRYRLIMHADGNMVLYDRNPTPDRACASSNTYRLGVRAVMQR